MMKLILMLGHNAGSYFLAQINQDYNLITIPIALENYPKQMFLLEKIIQVKVDF